MIPLVSCKTRPPAYATLWERTEGLVALTRISLAVIACCLGGAAAWPAAEQRPYVPKFAPDSTTAWQVNHPDGDDYIPPKSGPSPVTYDPKHPFVPTDPNSSIQPTYRIADLTNPILKPWAVERMRKSNEEVFNGKIPYVPRERCWPAGVPAYVLEPPFNVTMFIETPKQIIMIHNQGAELQAHPHERAAFEESRSRHGRVNPSVIGKAIRWSSTRSGSPIGPSSTIIARRTRARLHVVERFRLIDNGQTLEDHITVDDPGAFTMKWTAVQQWKRTIAARSKRSAVPRTTRRSTITTSCRSRRTTHRIIEVFGARSQHPACPPPSRR